MVKHIHTEARRNLEEKTKQYVRQANKDGWSLMWVIKFGSI